MLRDGGISVANIFIMMVPIILVSSLFLLKDISAYLVQSIEEKADISVYFNENTSEDDILRVKDKIAAIPNVNEVQYVSKDTALEDFTSRHQGDPVLLESLQEVNGNPFMASLNISASELGQYEQVSNLLGQDEYKSMINKVNYSEKKSVIDKVFAMTESATRTGLILFAALGLVSILVTFNTIRLAILNRGGEIEIQRLVGASGAFIRGQFIVEGIIFGLLAAIFCFFIVAGVVWYASPQLESMLPGLGLWSNFMAGIWTLFLIQFATGTGLGIFSSMVATTRYLKV